ncbi:MAG: SDR family NAD(P)-dependent oxidoreductase [Pseudomonadota bacterium]
MNTKTVLITGCSSGIGYDAAVGLKNRGWHVFASCRKAEDCERMRRQGFASPRIDYADPDSIASGLDEVLTDTGGQLDALFNNGAYAAPGAVEDMPTDALREIFEANFFGWHDLTRRVLPVMRAQGRGRIVQNSSVLGFVTLPWRGAYNATKHALEGLTDTLRIELRSTDIHVVLIEPGPVTSRIGLNAVAHFEKWIDWENTARADDYRNQLVRRLYGRRGRDPFELPATAVTKKLIHALEAYRPKPRYYVTTPTYFMGASKRILPTRALDWLIERV